MDYEFFEALSAEQARQFLSRFLEAERDSVEELLASARQAGLSADFKMESLVPILDFVARKIGTVSREPDNSLPDWIRHSVSYVDNLFDFDDESKVLVLRCAYYFGETFIRTFSRLYWGVGDSETALKNMPVIHGFRGGLELAPLLVLENVFGRVVSGRGGEADLYSMVGYWESLAPK